MENLNRIEAILGYILASLNNDHFVVITNQRGEVVDISVAFELSFGFTRAEVIGKPVSILIPERYKDEYYKGFNEVRADLSSCSLFGNNVLLHLLQKDGKEVAVKANLDVIILRRSVFFTAVIQRQLDESIHADV